MKQNNSNFVHSNFWTCWLILWSQFFMHIIYFISWKNEKARIEFMNFSQKYLGSVFFWGGSPSIYINVVFYIYCWCAINPNQTKPKLLVSCKPVLSATYLVGRVVRHLAGWKLRPVKGLMKILRWTVISHIHFYLPTISSWAGCDTRSVLNGV